MTKSLLSNLEILNKNAANIGNCHDTIQSLLMNPKHTYDVCLAIAANAVNMSKNGIDCVIPIPNGGLVLGAIVASILEVPFIVPYKGPNAPSEWIKEIGPRHTYTFDVDLIDIESSKNVLLIDDRTSVGICTDTMTKLIKKINGTIECYCYFELEQRSFDMFLENTKIDENKIYTIIKK